MLTNLNNRGIIKIPESTETFYIGLKVNELIRIEFNLFESNYSKKLSTWKRRIEGLSNERTNQRNMHISYLGFSLLFWFWFSLSFSFVLRGISIRYLSFSCDIWYLMRWFGKHHRYPHIDVILFLIQAKGFTHSLLELMKTTNDDNDTTTSNNNNNTGTSDRMIHSKVLYSSHYFYGWNRLNGTLCRS